jgi:hypothetical protein
MEDDCSYAHSEMEDLEDEESDDASINIEVLYDQKKEASEHESHKEPSEHESQQGFDYICPPTVKWLLYPDSDDEDQEPDDRKFNIQFQCQFRLDQMDEQKKDTA